MEITEHQERVRAIRESVCIIRLVIEALQDDGGWLTYSERGNFIAIAVKHTERLERLLGDTLAAVA